MNKSLSVLIIFLFSLLSTFCFAGDDGVLKLKERNKNGNIQVVDCFENVNRGIFGFNQVLDKIVFKPLAKNCSELDSVWSDFADAHSNLGLIFGSKTY